MRLCVFSCVLYSFVCLCVRMYSLCMNWQKEEGRKVRGSLVVGTRSSRESIKRQRGAALTMTERTGNQRLSFLPGMMAKRFLCLYVFVSGSKKYIRECIRELCVCLCLCLIEGGKGRSGVRTGS